MSINEMSTKEKIETIEDAVRRLETLIIQTCPHGHRLSIAMSNIEVAFAEASIAIEEEENKQYRFEIER